MKKVWMYAAVVAAVSLTSCGMSEEDKNKKLQEAAEMRAKQVCEGDGTLENYGQKLEYLGEQLREEGLDGEDDYKKATEMFDKKINETCPDKLPKE